MVLRALPETNLINTWLKPSRVEQMNRVGPVREAVKAAGWVHFATVPPV